MQMPELTYLRRTTTTREELKIRGGILPTTHFTFPIKTRPSGLRNNQVFVEKFLNPLLKAGNSLIK